eukprot:8270502-Pyramimonas_sp.AAC.1
MCWLRAPVCPAGSRCQRRRRDGTLSGKALDPHGSHAKSCEAANSRVARPDRLRDRRAATHQDITGHAAPTEQRVLACGVGQL